MGQLQGTCASWISCTRINHRTKHMSRVKKTTAMSSLFKPRKWREGTASPVSDLLGGIRQRKEDTLSKRDHLYGLRAEGIPVTNLKEPAMRQLENLKQELYEIQDSSVKLGDTCTEILAVTHCYVKEAKNVSSLYRSFDERWRGWLDSNMDFFLLFF